MTKKAKKQELYRQFDSVVDVVLKPLPSKTLTDKIIKQQTANSKQQTANSKQQTANSKQQTANIKDVY